MNRPAPDDAAIDAGVTLILPKTEMDQGIRPRR